MEFDQPRDLFSFMLVGLNLLLLYERWLFREEENIWVREEIYFSCIVLYLEEVRVSWNRTNRSPPAYV